jgi:hypothetical protein
MTIELTEEQATALRLIGWWMTCIDAGRVLDEESPLDDNMPALHFCSHGATGIVTIGNLRALALIDTKAGEDYRAIRKDVLEKIEQWSYAYPLDVFPEPDMAVVREALAARGITIDCVSASNMRHVIEQVQLMLHTNTP